MVEKPFTGVEQELNYVGKPFGSTVIGVGHLAIGMGAAKVAHQPHLIGVLPGGVEGQNVAIVLAVHRQDVVKAIEVSDLKLSRLPDQIDTPGLGGLGHTAIGTAANVVAGGARRVTRYAIAQPPLRNQVIHDVLG